MSVEFVEAVEEDSCSKYSHGVLDLFPVGYSHGHRLIMLIAVGCATNSSRSTRDELPPSWQKSQPS